MNQEWYFAGKAIAQIKIVFTTSIYDERKTQIQYFINVAVTRICCATACRQGGHLCWCSFVRKELPNLTKPEATPGDRI